MAFVLNSAILCAYVMLTVGGGFFFGHLSLPIVAGISGAYFVATLFAISMFRQTNGSPRLAIGMMGVVAPMLIMLSMWFWHVHSH